jgi:hypothetical protein
MEAAFSLAKLELIEGGFGRVCERGRAGADGALVRTVGSSGVGCAGRPIELNGAEVEAHAGYSYQKVMRFRQATSVPGEDPGVARENPSPPCQNAWPEARVR